MDKMKQWLQTHRPSTRRLVQLYTALLYNANLKGFAEGEIYQGKSKALCVPGLNCYSCPGAVGACPLGALQNAVAASAARPAFYVIGVLLLFGLLLGRTVCGWACPIGLLQEFLHKIPVPKLKKSRVTRALCWVKYLLLAILVLAVPLYYAFRRVPLPAFCKYVCPAGTLEGALLLLVHPKNAEKLGMLGALFTNKFVLLVLILTACMFLYRAFCRFLCPLGALYGLMTRLALIGVRLDAARCTDCGVCRALCPTDIRNVGDRECIACGKCVNRCPETAIQFRAGKFTLAPDAVLPASKQSAGAEHTAKAYARGKKIAVRAAALLILIAVLAAVNFPAAGQESASAPTESELASGAAVGERLPDFSVDTLNGTAFQLSSHRGSVVILNLWATWCGPCVQELPYFEAFLAQHPDAAVLAVHSGPIVEDVPAWVSAHDYSLPFAVDDSGALTALLGASSMLPHTLVLDGDGIVIYNAPGAVSPELLESLYLRAMQ